MKTFLDMSLVVFAALAAVLWLLSARAGSFSFMGTPMDEIEKHLTRQARLNSYAAAASCVAALLLAVRTVISN